MTRLLPKLYPLILLLLGILFFVPFLGYYPLFDGSEMRHAEVAREMLVTRTFGYAQLDFLPDHMTPPLLPWLQALSMRVFGVADNAELAARLPSALMGLVTILTLFFIGRKKHDARFGLLWGLSYLGSVTTLALTKSALPATTGSLFNFLGIVFLFRLFPTTAATPNGRNALLAGLFFGLAILTNGALISSFLLIVLVLTYYAQMTEQPLSAKIRSSLLVLVGPVLCSLGWLVSVPGNDWQHALVIPRDPVIFVYMLPGVIGALTPIVLSSRYWSVEKQSAALSTTVTFTTWMSQVAKAAIIIVVFVPGGVSLFWFPLSYLTTYHIYQILRGERSWDSLNTYLLIMSGVMVSGLMMAVPLLGMHPDWLARQTSDPYWVGLTEAPVSWAGWEWLIGAGLLLTTVIFAVRLRQRLFQSIIGLYLSSAVCTLAFLAVIVPKIEQYTQQPLIDFCEAKWNQPVYVQPSFPSYAHLFYTRKQPPVNPASRDIYWLVNKPVDRQTFIITTATDAARYRYNPNLELLSEEYGYVFFTRKQYR